MGDVSVNRVLEFVKTSLGCTVVREVEEHWCRLQTTLKEPECSSQSRV